MGAEVWAASGGEMGLGKGNNIIVLLLFVWNRCVIIIEVERIFKRVAARLNLDPARPVSRISAHSTRIGAAQDLTAAGAALLEIMVAGGWKSPQMPAHYSRKLDARHGATRRMLKSALEGCEPIDERGARSGSRLELANTTWRDSMELSF